jgi:hypothetical protein
MHWQDSAFTPATRRIISALARFGCCRGAGVLLVQWESKAKALDAVVTNFAEFPFALLSSSAY